MTRTAGRLPTKPHFDIVEVGFHVYIDNSPTLPYSNLKITESLALFAMAALRNKINKKVLAERLKNDPTPRKTVSFYRYVRIEHPQQMRDTLYQEWDALGALGRIYVAQEGINAQMSVPEANWDAFVTALYAHPEFADMPFKIGLSEHKISFITLMMKVKTQIVADGLTIDDYDIENVGNHLEPADFHAAMEDPETIVVDMRNHYESRIGHFEGAICPDADTFREELPAVKDQLEDKKDKKILLYCTGGIRCEKASAYLKHHGFTNVNQLHGGIIEYAHYVKQAGVESKFKGKNFVFDGRMAERVTEDLLTNCDQCGTPSDNMHNCANAACNLLFVQCEDCVERWDNTCGEACKAIVAMSEEEQRAYRSETQPITDHTLFKSRQRPNLSIKQTS
jgi:UPF0176 protein